VASGAAPALLQPAAVLWIAAFAAFAVRYFPILTRPRLDA
jgi:uncharacterized protein involved in response to NO